MTTNRKRPLMGVDNILQMQDNGYKSSVSAISEIIDNSIQANAKTIDVIIIRNTTRSKNEIDELLDSLTKQDYSDTFEVLLIEDGSTKKSESIADTYRSKLDLNYFFKENHYKFAPFHHKLPNQKLLFLSIIHNNLLCNVLLIFLS